MPALEPLSHLLKIYTSTLSKEENLILETALFNCMYKELRNFFSLKHQEFFRLLKFTKEMEQEMLDENFINYLITDILLTEEYSLEGISHYTQIPKEVIYDLVISKNSNPSLLLTRKIMNLHYSVRKELYSNVMKKVVIEYVGDK